MFVSAANMAEIGVTLPSRFLKLLLSLFPIPKTFKSIQEIPFFIHCMNKTL